MGARSKMAISRRALLGVAAAAAIPAQAWAAPAGSVLAVEGRGFAEAGAVWRELSAKSNVFIGDLVGTGISSRLAMQLGASTLVRLGPEARVQIDSFIVNAGGVLDLQSGAMLFDGPPQQSRGISVRSPFALIAVRGTRFFAGPSRGVFGVFVARGRVRVTAGGRRVELAQGMGTNIASPGMPPTDPTAWGGERIREALASVQ
jgi:ferric-dicitrate binding protein FerR (iron transport regulator)